MNEQPTTNGNHLIFRGKKIEIDEVKATEDIQNLINAKRKEMNIFDIETAKVFNFFLYFIGKRH